MSRLNELRPIAGFFDLRDPAERARSTKALVALYLDLVSELGPAVTAEIGAFDAGFSIEVKRRLPATTAIAFEANPYNFQVHSPKALEAGVEYVHTAVADVDGAITFNIQANYAGQPLARVKGEDSILTRSAPNFGYEEVTVAATTLDRLFEQPRFVDARPCLWVDVEGAAGKVLQGAQAVLDRVDMIMIEMENYPFWEGQWLSGAVDAFLGSKGFEPVARDFEYEHQFNAIYLKPRVMAGLYRFDYLLTGYYSGLGVTRRSAG